MSEEKDRIIINSMLEDAGWILKDSDGVRNVDFEVRSKNRPADYVLKDKNNFPGISPPGLLNLSIICQSLLFPGFLFSLLSCW